MRKQWIPGPSFFSLTRAEGPGYEASKVFAGQMLAYYLWCALFEISGCLTSLCGIRDIIYSLLYLSSYLFHVERLNIVVPGT